MASTTDHTEARLVTNHQDKQKRQVFTLNDFGFVTLRIQHVETSASHLNYDARNLQKKMLVIYKHVSFLTMICSEQF